MENQDQQPQLCTNGCGFFGAPSNNGMCSKCYKLRHPEPPQVAAIGTALTARSSRNRINIPSGHPNIPIENPLAENPDATPPLEISQPPKAGVGAGEVKTEPFEGGQLLKRKSGDLVDENEGPTARSSSPAAKINPSSKTVNRCKECSKRVGLAGFTCRCGELFCGTHRYSDIHKCPFDYRSLGTEEIRKNNPVVKGDKIQKL